MTLYWERCDICGRHYPTRPCFLRPDVNVCPYCCVACPLRSKCSKPAWFATLSVSRVSPVKKEKEIAKKALEELLRRLEAG